jgi:rod shape-determining protein MreD
VSDALAVAGLVLVAALLQSAVFSSLEVVGGTPDLLLVTLLGIALLRGSVTGAAAGFLGGLVLDVANMGILGVTSLLLTGAGYWTGRYGETTGRDRAHAPFLAVVVLTVLVAVAGYVLHFMLGENVSARTALFDTLLPGLGLNLIIAAPVFAICRRLLPLELRGEHMPGVRLLGQ